MSAPYHHTCDSSPTYCLGAQLLYSADKPGKTVHTYVVSYTTHPLALTHPSTSTQVSGIPSQTRCPHTSPCTQVITYVRTYVYVHPQLLYSTNVRIPTHQPFQLPTPTCTIYSHSLPQPNPPPLTLLTHSSPPHMHQTLSHSLAITNSDKACMLYPACISKEKQILQ